MTNENPQSTDGDGYEKIGEIVAIFLRSGGWHCNYSHTGRQVRKSLRTKSKKEARRKALLIEKEVLAGEHKPQRQAALLATVIEVYLEHLRSEGRSPKTLTKYEFCFSLLKETVAKQRSAPRISDIGIGIVDSYRATRTAGNEKLRPAKAKTIYSDTIIIRQLVNFAISRGLVSEDPLKNLKIKKPKRTTQPCWTRAEVDRILAAAEPPYDLPLTFLAETGARVGEAKWLTWDDVDLARRLVHIRPKAGWRPKSGDERAIPMNDRLLEALRTAKREGHWVFIRGPLNGPRPADQQLRERRLLKYLKRILRPLGLRGHVHTFRHSFISFAAYEGVSERVLRTWIGHVSRETLDWYFHLADKQSHAAMQHLSDAAKRIAASKDTVSSSARFQHTERSEENEGDAT